MSEPAIVKINEKPLDLLLTEADFPPAPLVYADDTSDKESFKVRIVAFLPIEIEIIPTCKAKCGGNAEKITIEGESTIVARSFLVEYNSRYPVAFTHVNVWSISFDYSLNGEDPVDYIITHVQNMDPKTSRGTVTTVQRPHETV